MRTAYTSDAESGTPVFVSIDGNVIGNGFVEITYACRYNKQARKE
jgi:hypothetical protein